MRLFFLSPLTLYQFVLLIKESEKVGAIKNVIHYEALSHGPYLCLCLYLCLFLRLVIHATLSMASAIVVMMRDKKLKGVPPLRYDQRCTPNHFASAGQFIFTALAISFSLRLPTGSPPTPIGFYIFTHHLCHSSTSHYNTGHRSLSSPFLAQTQPGYPLHRVLSCMLCSPGPLIPCHMCPVGRQSGWQTVIQATNEREICM